MKIKVVKIKRWCLHALFFLLVFQSVLEEYWPFCKYIDELFSIFIFLSGAFVWGYKGKGKLNSSLWMLIVGLAVFNVFGWLSSYLTEYRCFKISLLSCFLANKFFLTLLGVMGLCVYTNIRKYLTHLLFMVRPMLIMLSLWHLISSIAPQMLIPFSVLELIAKAVFLSALIFLDWRKRKDYIYIVLTILLLLSTGKAKAYGATLIILAIIIWVLKMNKKVHLIEIIIGGLGVTLLAWEKIYSNYVIGMEVGYPRAMLLKYGAVIAKERFPFGTGWGTFGSHHAAQYYSPVYVELGWTDHYTVGAAYTGFLNDVYWPSVYAEAGWIGLAGLIVVLVCAFYQIQKQFYINKKIYAAGFLCWTYVLITTLESTAFANPAVLVLAIVWGLVVTNGIMDTTEEKSKDIDYGQEKDCICGTWFGKRRCRTCGINIGK